MPHTHSMLRSTHNEHTTSSRSLTTDHAPQHAPTPPKPHARAPRHHTTRYSTRPRATHQAPRHISHHHSITLHTTHHTTTPRLNGQDTVHAQHPSALPGQVKPTDHGFQVLTGSSKLRARIRGGSAIGWEEGGPGWLKQRDAWMAAVAAAPRVSRVSELASWRESCRGASMNSSP